LWYEKPLYGKVDNEQNVVIIDATSLEPVGGPGTFFAANFVAELSFSIVNFYFKNNKVFLDCQSKLKLV